MGADSSVPGMPGEAGRGTSHIALATALARSSRDPSQTISGPADVHLSHRYSSSLIVVHVSQSGFCTASRNWTVSGKQATHNAIERCSHVWLSLSG